MVGVRWQVKTGMGGRINRNTQLEFQATVNREVTNINDRANVRRCNSRRKTPDIWSEAVRKANIGMRDIAVGKNTCRQDAVFQAVILKSEVDFRRVLDGLWKTCWERINK